MIHDRGLLRRDLDRNAADRVDGIDQSIEINGYVFINIQIQIAVEHVDRFLGSTVIISIIAFADRSFSVHIHCRITVNAHQLDFFGVVVDADNDNAVRITGIIIAVAAVIHTEAGDIGISAQHLSGLSVQFWAKSVRSVKLIRPSFNHAKRKSSRRSSTMISTIRIIFLRLRRRAFLLSFRFFLAIIYLKYRVCLPKPKLYEFYTF